MNIFVEEFYSGSKVCIYTVRKEEAELSETQDFFRRVGFMPEYIEDAQKLSRLLSNQIANIYGAHDKYFNRNEKRATALPPSGRYKGFKGEKVVNFSYFPLRLYSLRLSNSVIVLFNGGIKETGGSAQNDEKVSIYFQEANEFTKRIFSAIREETICLNYKSMVDFQGNKTIIL